MSSNLVEHARRELELIGEDPEVIAGYIKVFEAFSDMGHSGGSASVAIPVINELLQWKNLKPLTDDPEEWIHIADEISGSENVYQNNRNSEAFSHDGGKTYYLLSEGAHFSNREPLHNSVPKADINKVEWGVAYNGSMEYVDITDTLDDARSLADSSGGTIVTKPAGSDWVEF